MFFTLDLSHEILLEPEYFGPGIQDVIKKKLHREIENTCLGKHGFIVAVTNIRRIGKGMVLPGRGEALFPIDYTAIVFRPFKGEVVDAIVKSVSKVGIFADVGPLTLFVSNHWVPNMEFDGSSNPPCFKTDDESERITAEDAIRVRIIGTRVNAAEIVASASLEGDYLGLSN